MNCIIKIFGQINLIILLVNSLALWSARQAVKCFLGISVKILWVRATFELRS